MHSDTLYDEWTSAEPDKSKLLKLLFSAGSAVK